MSRVSKVSIIGSQTKLSGSVESEDVMIIAGYVEGDVRSTKVVIKECGRVEGNITCKSLVIEPGGIFDGRASMLVKNNGDLLAPEGT